MKYLSKTKLEFPWKQPETLEGEERINVSMNIFFFSFFFFFFFGSSSPLPLRTLGCHLERFQASEGIKKPNI